MKDKRVKQLIITIAIILVLLGGFFLYSGAVTFSNWPWTSSEKITKGEHLGFRIGDSKEHVFSQAINNQKNGIIMNLVLLDQEYRTYSEQFRGNNLQLSDFNIVSSYNRWHMALVGENAWLHLIFENDRLATIVVYKYSGPTE